MISEAYSPSLVSFVYFMKTEQHTVTSISISIYYRAKTD